ncbi:hypothetical protein QBC40DRAFT_95254 [Triangularia verruculosa]|uniref:HTH APSES-type domain-containing protein n=1 Tax=Triangularia verruculosa TaxID=2587418 RepID=A0AAN6XCL4_9PEZI|nr:hypothetical protein QBC40DRAFT_95254 [Triangularia verruculosa]
MTTQRQLPQRHNHFMTDDVPPHNELVGRRRLGRTKLSPKVAAFTLDPSEPFDDTFDYAHLRAPLPKGIVSPIWGLNKSSPSSYFLMRRSRDGFVSATGMFKASFPYANLEEEEAERKYIKLQSTTSPNETAGNVWIPPQQALDLAVEYKILPWIRALLDPTEIALNPSSDAPKAPPPFTALGQHVLPPPTPSRLRRSSRSASPAKTAPPSTRRPIATPRRRRAGSKPPVQAVESQPADSQATLVNGHGADEEIFQRSSVPAPVTTVAKVEEIAEGEVKVEAVEQDAAAVLNGTDKEPKIRVHVDQDIKVDEDGEQVKHTKVDVEVPIFGGKLPSSEEAAKMVAEARAMVEAATKAVDGEAAVEPTKSKRKADDIAEDEEDEDEDAAESRSAKKVKTEAEIRKEKIRRRAFFGVTATVAVGAIGALLPMITPYIANAL